MKVEIGESLMLSWLRHVRKCQIAQLNWKPSVDLWKPHHEAVLDQIMMETQDLYLPTLGIGIFPPKSNRSQVMRQSEIDVLGIEIQENGQWHIHAIDVAFHEGGLGYGHRQLDRAHANVARVLKKLVRMAMCVYCYFGTDKANLIFASPVVRDDTRKLLVSHVEMLNQYFAQRSLRFKADLYLNDEFRDDILKPVMKQSTAISDTSELFLRSIQLVHIFDGLRATDEREAGEHTTRSAREPEQGLVVGQLVQTTMARLARNGSLTDQEVLNLQDKEYSRRVFGLNHPFLKELRAGETEAEQRNVNGYPRYYSKVHTINGRQYLLCKEWYEDRNRRRFETWLEGVQREI